MRNSRLFILCLACISIIACKKNSTTTPPVKQQETPLQNLVLTKFLDTIRIVNNGKFEEGYSFSSSKNGKITKLGCYMPNNLTYRVSLWDSASQNLLQAISVQVTDPTKFNYVDIAPIFITANKTYFITINNTIGGTAKDYFRLGKKPNFDVYFPIKTGFITIEAYTHNQGCSTTCFPDFTATKSDGLYGIPDFVFEPEN